MRNGLYNHRIMTMRGIKYSNLQTFFPINDEVFHLFLTTLPTSVLGLFDSRVSLPEHC